jgi:hypothetical protein
MKGNISQAADQAGITPNAANLATGTALAMANPVARAFSPGTNPTLKDTAQYVTDTQRELNAAKRDVPALQNSQTNAYENWATSQKIHQANTNELLDAKDRLRQLDAQISDLTNPSIGPATTPGGFKQEPISRAAANYGAQHGLTTSQQNIAADTTKNPGGVWDYINQNRQGFVNAENTAPGYRPTPGGEIVLNPHDQAIVDKRRVAQLNELQKQRDAVQAWHDTAQEKADASSKDLAQKQLAKDKAASVVPEQQSSIDVLENRIKPYLSNPLVKFGLNRISRSLPLASGFNVERNAEQAKQDWEQGNYGRMLTHGLGSLGALASSVSPTVAAFGAEPIAAGLAGFGTAAQMPAAGLDTYDFYKKMNQPVPKTP